MDVEVWTERPRAGGWTVDHGWLALGDVTEQVYMREGFDGVN